MTLKMCPQFPRRSRINHPRECKVKTSVAITFLAVFAVTASVSAEEVPTDGLLVWLEAADAISAAEKQDGLRVEKWTHRSNSGRSFVQSQRSSQPHIVRIDQHPVVRFDGVDDHLRWLGDDVEASALTMIIVAAPRENPGDFRGLFALNARDSRDYESGFNLDMGPAPSSVLSFLNVEGRGFSGARDLLKSEFAFGTLQVIECTVDSKVRRVALSIDGGESEIRESNGQSISLAEWTLGARYYTNGNGPQKVRGSSKVDIAAVLVWDRLLNPEERRSVGTYLEREFSGLRKSMLENAANDRTVPLVRFENPPIIQPLVPGFSIVEIPVELTNVNNLRFREDGVLVTVGYNGDINLLRDTDGDGLEDAATCYWKNDGSVRGPLGMLLTGQDDPQGQGVIVPSKGRVSFFVDQDGDGQSDEQRIIATGWQEIPQNVDAVGIARDAEGAIYFGLGTANYANGYLVDDSGKAGYDLKSDRGTIQRIAPDWASRETVCTGVRFPVALAFHSNGDLFCTDQEGATWLPNGNPFDELLHIEKGRHYGFPPRHPRHNPDVIDEPSVYDFGPQHQSTCGMIFNVPHGTGAAFGPEIWDGDVITCGESRGKLWRTQLVKTPHGYVAASQLIACLQMLTVDTCLAPNGDLVVACHSGPPDWGTGPTGIGKLFRIKHTDTDAPAVVAVWAESDREVRVAFDRPIDSAWAQRLAKQVRVRYGEYVRAGDEFENLVPPYAVVQSQLRNSRYELDVYSVALTGDLQTLIINTERMIAPASYAISTIADDKLESLDKPLFLDYVLGGVRVKWQPENRDQDSIETWLPHIDLQVSRQLLHGSQIHQQLFDSLSTQSGVLEFETQLNLKDLLRPAVQKGASLNFSYPDEMAEFLVDGATQIFVDTNDQIEQLDTGVDVVSESNHIVRWKQPVSEWVRLRVRVDVEAGKRPTTAIYFRTNEDSRLRALPLNRFWLPWVRNQDDFAEGPFVQEIASELKDANWGKGRRLYHSESLGCFKCHVIDGNGGKIGPDLSNLRFRDYDSVLRDIRRPNYSINPDYISHVAQLNDGRVLTGTLRSRDGRLVLGDARGNEHDLHADEIEILRPSGSSIMPEQLIEKLSEDQIHDLMAYLLLEPPHMPLQSPLDAPPLRTIDEVVSALEGSERHPSTERELSIVLVAGNKDHGPGEHDYPAWQIQWGQLIAAAENVDVSLAWNFPNDQQLSQADVLVFFQKGAWNRERQDRMDTYFARGGGAVYIHWAVNGDEQVVDFAQRIGIASRGGTIGYRHGPLTLNMHSTDHPIVRNYDRLDLYDESYWRMTGSVNNVTLLATSEEEGEARPQMWTYERDAGRVFVSIPGHYSWTFDDPLFRILLMRGIAWTAHESVDRFNELVTLGARIQR